MKAKVSLEVKLDESGALVEISGSADGLELVKEALDKAESSPQGVATVKKRKGVPCRIRVVRIEEEARP